MKEREQRVFVCVWKTKEARVRWSNWESKNEFPRIYTLSDHFQFNKFSMISTHWTLEGKVKQSLIWIIMHHFLQKRNLDLVPSAVQNSGTRIRKQEPKAWLCHRLTQYLNQVTNSPYVFVFIAATFHPLWIVFKKQVRIHQKTFTRKLIDPRW